MELRQLEYIIAIADEQSIAKAAQKLFITQSALNQQLLKLERELGVPLFNRIKEGMVPTHAGEIYLETARKMLLMKADTYRYIQDIADMKKGVISIAYTPEQGSLMFSRIYPTFHRMYPDITFKIHEARVTQGEQLLMSGKVNLALTSHSPGEESLSLNTTLPEQSSWSWEYQRATRSPGLRESGAMRHFPIWIWSCFGTSP